jgi:hypothetical protein
MVFLDILDVLVTGMRKTLLAGRMGYPLAVAARGAGDDTRFS